MRHYGVDKFTIELARSDARSFAELQSQEVDEISNRDTINNGYNVSPGGSIGTPTKITVGEMAFPSRGSAADYFGIDVSVFNIRLSRLGWTSEQAAEIEPRGKYSRNKTIVSGVEFGSIKKAAEIYGLPYQLVWDRIKTNGWTVEQALGIASPPDSSKFSGIKVSAFGQDFSSAANCARQYGIAPETLRRQLKNGLPLEQTISIILANKKRLNK